ncbi:hypothetical protein [Microbacterium sp. 2FI]|uniref:hypothetical protein n=1 Tax=Microbacterium sp. 2FI TaxID=2502193 RepID=UPI0010F476C1|nr:hypothetical protein [Microbacterium sp. 2FI]
MPKQLINIIGIVVCVGVIALAVSLVALPTFFQSLSTTEAAQQVDQTNAIYQARVDDLRAEAERMDEIEASVAALRAEIPATNKLDDVFELVAKAATAASVDVQSITAGATAAFVERVAASPVGEAPAPPAEEAAADGADTNDAGSSAETTTPRDGREQVDFTIAVNAEELSEVVAFLDQLRTGPRLLGNVESEVTPTGTGFAVSVSALTFVLPES